MSEQDFERIAEAAARRVVRAELRPLWRAEFVALLRDMIAHGHGSARGMACDTIRDFEKMIERVATLDQPQTPPEQRAGLETVAYLSRSGGTYSDRQAPASVKNSSIWSSLVLRSDAEAAIAQARAEGRREAFGECAETADNATSLGYVLQWCKGMARL